MENQMQPYHVHISAQHNWFDLRLKEVWQYRELIWLFTKRSFTVSFKQTILGPAWLFISPLISSFMYTIVFGQIAKLGTDGIPQILFYLCGNAIWHFFSSCLSSNSGTFVGNSHLFGKVYFPRLTVPCSTVLSQVIRFGIQMLLVLGFLIYYVSVGAVHPNYWAWPLIPLVLLELGLMGMGCGIIVSSVTTKYRDLSVLVSFGLSLWMYGTPVIYPLSTLSGGILQKLLLLNPVTMPIEIFRYAVLGVGTIYPVYIVTSCVFTLVVALFGIVIFNRVERTFMDTV